jgi:hypothetical protein
MLFQHAFWRTLRRAVAPAVRLSAALAFAVLANAAAPVPALAQNTPAGTRLLKDVVGVATKFRQGEPQADLALLQDLGVKWVREEIYWTDVEPQPGNIVEFWPATIERFKFYKANDIGVVMLLYGGNPGYGDYKTNPAGYFDPVAYGRFVATVAQRLKAMGVRFVIEVWNEPHNTLLPAFGGQWNGRPPSPWLDHYLKLVREANRQVKAVDVNIKVINDDDMWVLHYWFLEGGLPADLNGFAIHPYAPRGPERVAIDYNTDWVAPFQAVDADASFQSAVRRLKEQGMVKMGRTPEIYVTEMGWQLGGASPYGVVTEDILSALLPRAFMVAHASGVNAMTWFSLRDAVDGPMGLTDNTGYRRVPYFALKALRGQLGESRLVRQALGQSHLTTGTQAYLYQPTGSRSQKLAIWDITGTVRPLVFPGNWSRVTVVDHLGRVVNPGIDARGNRFVSVGLAPLYLSGVSDDTALRQALLPLQ